MRKILKQLLTDDGYTFIEVFLGLLIMGLISIIIYTNLSSITNSVKKSRDNLSYHNELLSLKLILNDELNKISPPWFLQDIYFTKDDNTLEVYYYNGIEDSYILFDYREATKITINQTMIFHSDLLTGSFTLNGSSINYSDHIRTMTFPLGVLVE